MHASSNCGDEGSVNTTEQAVDRALVLADVPSRSLHRSCVRQSPSSPFTALFMRVVRCGK